jgi:hypothetical protein
VWRGDTSQRFGRAHAGGGEIFQHPHVVVAFLLDVLLVVCVETRTHWILSRPLMGVPLRDL